MKHCSLLCIRWWPLVFIGIPMLFMLPLLAFKWRFIEADVAHNTATNLQSGNVNWANIETRNRGRHVLITGSPPSQDAIDQARNIAETSDGVDKVSLTTEVKAPLKAKVPLKYAELTASLVNNKLQLNGVVSSQSEKDSLVLHANSIVGSDNVINRLSVSSNTMQLPDPKGLFSVLIDNAQSSKNLTLNVKRNVLTIAGDVFSNASKTSLASSVNQQYSGQVVNALSVIAPPISKRDVCRDSVNELLNNNQINFQTGKAIISPESFELLASIKSIAQECPDTDFEIAGHTDSSGRLSFNMSLSQARAKAVLDHLVNLGLKDTQFIATGYGPNQPIAENSSAQGRAKNRRIEFKLKN